MIDRVYEFDNAAKALLSQIPDVVWYESNAENVNTYDDPQYGVYFGNDVLAMSPYTGGGIAGHQDDAIVHPFSVFVSAPNQLIMNKLVSKIRSMLIGKTLIEGSSGIGENGTLNSYGDSDATLKPVKYTYFMSFTTTIDRSDT